MFDKFIELCKSFPDVLSENREMRESVKGVSEINPNINLNVLQAVN